MTRPPVVKCGWPCPKCETDDAFITKVALGDYVEVVNEKNKCSNKDCGYVLTQEEEQDMCDRAWENAPEDYAGEKADWLYDRARDR